VNFPPCASDEVVGLAVTVQGGATRSCCGSRNAATAAANPYYWIGFGLTRSVPQDGSDLEALAKLKISVTPLRIDLTDGPTFTRYARALG